VQLRSDALVDSFVGVLRARPRCDFPGYALRRAADRVIADLTARLVTLGLRVTDASVLMLVGKQRNVTSSDIGRVLNI
jgi:hypothetical protein